LPKLDQDSGKGDLAGRRPNAKSDYLKAKKAVKVLREGILEK